MWAGRWRSVAAKDLPGSGRFLAEIVPLKYADPQQVVSALTYFSKSANAIIYIPSTQTLILRDYAENVKRMLEMLEKIDVTSPLIIKPKVIPIKYALASDISSALSALGAGAGGSVGRSTSGSSFSTGATGTSTGGSFSSPGGAAPSIGTPTQSGPSTGASGARSNFGQRLGAIVDSREAGERAAFRYSARPKSLPTSAPTRCWSSPTMKT